MGEPVVAVVAESRAAARAAADAVYVDYEELPAVVDTLAALAPGAPVICPEAPDNIAAEARYGDAKAVAEAFAKAAHTVSLDIENQRLAASPIEPRTVLAAFEAASGKLTVRIASQMPTAVRTALCDDDSRPHAAERARGRGRRGRRLRHEDRRLSRGCRGGLRGAPGEAAGEVGRRAHPRNSSRPSTAATP